MTIYTNSPWTPKPKKKNNSTLLKKEEDRWAALLDDPTAFVRNPLKYGELTFEGYAKARLSSALVYRDTWPKGPDAIVSLLLHCNIDASQAGRATAIHANRIKYDMDNQSMLSELLLIHMAILKRLHVKPGPQELNDVLDHADILHLNFMDYMRSFDVMQDYLKTEEDESVFLDALLDRLIPSRHCYSSDHTTGLALAASFTRANPQKIIDWCKQHDDQVGLGYLVVQGKYRFSDWITEVANPSHGLRIRHNEDADESMSTRAQEQLDTLNHLVAQVPDEVFAKQGPLVLERDPSIATSLLSRTSVQASSTAAIAWNLLLVHTNVIPPDHPGLLRWLDSAAIEQRKLVAKAENDLSDEHFRVHGDAPDRMYTLLPAVAQKISPKARHLLATNLLMECHPQRTADMIYAMPSTSWLQGLHLADALVARANTIDDRQVSALILPFYPLLPADEKRKCIELLVSSTAIDQLSAKAMVKTLQQVDPIQFDKRLVSKHKGLAYVMHHLTQKDPEQALSAVAASMAALDISKSDPGYLEALQKWVKDQVSTNNLVLTMPHDLGDNTCNTFSI